MTAAQAILLTIAAIASIPTGISIKRRRAYRAMKAEDALRNGGRL